MSPFAPPPFLSSLPVVDFVEQSVTLGCRARVETHLPTSTSHSLTVLSNEALEWKRKEGKRKEGREGWRERERREEGRRGGMDGNVSPMLECEEGSQRRSSKLPPSLPPSLPGEQPFLVRIVAAGARGRPSDGVNFLLVVLQVLDAGGGVELPDLGGGRRGGRQAGREGGREGGV